MSTRSEVDSRSVLRSGCENGVLLQGHGIVVNGTPTSARFALHDLLALGDRSEVPDRCDPGAPEQAEALLDVLGHFRSDSVDVDA